MGQKRNKKVIYTAIFGDYNGLIPQPKVSGFDYVCFTDNPQLKAKPWKTIHVEPKFKNDLTRSNRYIKILPHKFLQDYDVSIYIDGNFWILSNLNKLIDKYLLYCNMATFSHVNTFPDSRNCIYKEHQAILDLEKKEGYFRDDPQIMKKFIDKILSEGYPQNNGLIKGGCLVRRHQEKDVIQVMEDWWYMIEHYSKRDQLSFNYVAWKNNFEFATIPGDIRRGNPYVYWLGQHRANWKTKLYKVQLKQKLGLIKIPKP